MKRIPTVIAVNMLSVCALFAAAEFAVRFTQKEIQPLGTDRALVSDSLFHKSPGLRPNSRGRSNGVPVRVDEHGFRKTSVPLRPGREGRLLVGDSVTLGIGVEEDSTFAGILHRRLDTMNVLNPSVIGFSVRDYENVIRYYLAERPDLNISRVTVCWCLNDLYQDITDIETPGGKWRSIFSNVLLRLRSKSHLFLFLKKTGWDRPRSYYQFDSGFYENDHPWLIDAADRLDAIHRFCEEQQVRFDMILLPYAFQLRPPGDVRPQQGDWEATRRPRDPLLRSPR